MNMKDTLETPYSLYQKANYYLNEGLIRAENLDATRQKNSGFEWMPRFLEAFSNPQRGIPAVHIAGTSGKGTTAIMIAEILRAAGIRTGLHISPYLQVATEKIWIDGSYYGGEEFYELVESMKPTIESFRKYDLPLHGMASVCLAIEAFRQSGVEIMVFETGVGGRVDLTNHLDTMLSVITKIGFDHQKTLGKTISEIAFHKAGIIKKETPAIAFRGPGIREIQKEAAFQKAPLHLISRNNWSNCKTDISGTMFSFRNQEMRLDDLKIKACGPFQVENASLAIAAAQTLQKRGFSISEKHIRAGLERAVLPGRVELVSVNPPCIIDGAHNGDKIDNLYRFVKAEKKTEITIICGILAKKVKRKMLTKIAKIADHIITTEPQVFAKSAFPADMLSRRFRQLGVKKVRSIASPMDAIGEALNHKQYEGGTIIVTGSLYLVGNIRNYWYSDENVLLQKTSYPVRTAISRFPTVPSRKPEQH